MSLEKLEWSVSWLLEEPGCPSQLLKRAWPLEYSFRKGHKHGSGARDIWVHMFVSVSEAAGRPRDQGHGNRTDRMCKASCWRDTYFIYIYVGKYTYFLLRSFHPYKGTRSSHLYSFCLCECCCSMFLYLGGQLCESTSALCVCLFRVHSDTSLLAVPRVPELIHQIQQFVISTFGETWETDNENCKNCEEMSFLGKKRSKGKKSVL